MFIDAHTHLLGKKIFRQFEILRDNWIKNGITQIIQMPTSLHESKKSLDSFVSLPEVHIGVGKHPWKVKNNSLEEKQEFENLIAKKGCEIIGEVGLDYYAVKDEARYVFQREWFEFFIDMSNKYKKPLNIHLTGAEKDVYELLSNNWDKTSTINIHWYSGPLDSLQKLIELGCFFSINPAVYYSTGHQNALKIIPSEKILTESDGDVFYKPINELGEPSLVIKVVNKICELKNLEKEELINTIAMNFLEYIGK